MSVLLSISFLLLVPCFTLISASNSTFIEPNCEFLNKKILWCQNGIPDLFLYNRTILDSVYSLWITNCDYVQIEKNTFPNFNILNEVKIKCEKTEIANGSFDHQLNVSLVNIGENVITFPKNIFCDYNNLQHLWLERNQLSADDDVGLFTNCSAFSQNVQCGRTITWLSLANNNLTSIENDGFLCNLRSLTRLDLSNNSISKIQKDAFNSVPELLALKLAGNLLSNFTSDIFASLSMLLDLDLSYNEISSVPEGFLNSSPNLRNLKLAGNLLTRLNNKIFENVSDLFKLDISNNELFNISQSLANLTQLNSLKLSSNRLENIDSSMFFNLSKLSLDRNLISQIPEDAFAGCSRLRELNLSYNRLREVPNLNSSHGISFVHLQHNIIQNISTNFSSDSDSYFSRETKNLRLLNLSHNNIEFVDESIIRALSQKILFISIDMLDLSHNQINSFEFPNNVIELNLAHNRIEQLPFYRSTNTSAIEHLNLSHNLIVNISSDQFPPSLTRLFLEWNKINYFDSTIFKNLTNLKILNLRNNLLTTLYDFNLPRTVSFIYIRENPWSCECHLIQPVFNLIQTHRRQIKNGNELFCQTNNTTEPPMRIVNFNITQCAVFN